MSERTCTAQQQLRDLYFAIAADLLSENGENPEYDRAIAEMTTRLLGLGSDHTPEVALELRSMRAES